MQSSGPSLEELTRRLAECPSDFLARPAEDGRPGTVVEAVAGDLLASLGAPLLDEERAGRLRGRPGSPFERNRLGLMLVSCWLLGAPCFRGRAGLAGAAEDLLVGGLDALASVVRFQECVTDPDRREELARLALAALGLRPEGETPEQAADRFRALDSVETRRLGEASAERLARVKKVARRMARRAAQEAAAKVSRE